MDEYVSGVEAVAAAAGGLVLHVEAGMPPAAVLDIVSKRVARCRPLSGHGC